MQEAAALKLITQWGYIGILGGMILEGLSVPFPGAAFVLLGGALAAKLRLNLWLVGLAAVLGYALGAFGPYFLARKSGRQVFLKYGKYISLTPEKLQVAEFWFEKYGAWVVCLSRPFFFGNYVSYLAGLAKMNLGTYLLFTLLGTLPWCFALSAFGYYAGQGFLAVIKEYGVVAALILTLILAGVGFASKAIYTRWWNQKFSKK